MDARAQDLLDRMTLEEKLAQIGGVWAPAVSREGRLSEERAKEVLCHGMGHITRIAGSGVLGPRECARLANEIQRFLVESTRLGIPAIVHEESCAGFTARGATCFPQAIGLASTWDPDLILELAGVIRAQMRAVGAHQALAPVLDLARDPRWGRAEETYGEDPHLAGRIGVAYVRGLQGDDLRRGIAATGKHFVGYGASEGGLNWAPAHLPRRELLELFVQPFEAAIREAGLASVMNAYHEIDGVPLGASRELLNNLLREELGFEGAVVADYYTVPTLMSYHRIAASKGEAARRALEAGIDVELPALDCYGEPLREAVEAGRVPLEHVDRAVGRLLRLKLRLGLFEHPYVEVDAAAAVFDTPPQRELARRAAEKSFVLLKNDGELLPLSPSIAKLALIGPCAHSARLLQGDYHYPTHLEAMFGSIPEEDVASSPDDEGGTPALAPGVDAARIDLAEHFPPMVTLLEGIRSALGEGTEILHVPGCGVLAESPDGFDAARRAAAAAEVAIVAVGGRSGLVEGCTSGESVDRADLGLPGAQQALVETVVGTGTPTVVVLVNGRPLALPWIAEHVPAILEVWLPGEEGGAALARVLFGSASPGGRLPVSLPRSVGQLPLYYNHKPSGGRSQWRGDYADLSTQPLFPFGHGLSYTRFEYANLEVTPARLAPTARVSIGVDVTNAGARAGDEVVQLYVHDEVASATRPVRELKGFRRLTLRPAETRRVSFHLDARQLAFYDPEMRLVVEPGRVEVMLGASSQDIRLTGGFEITGETLEIARGDILPTRVEVR